MFSARAAAVAATCRQWNAGPGSTTTASPDCPDDGFLTLLVQTMVDLDYLEGSAGGSAIGCPVPGAEFEPPDFS